MESMVECRISGAWLVISNLEHHKHILDKLVDKLSYVHKHLEFSAFKQNTVQYFKVQCCKVTTENGKIRVFCRRGFLERITNLLSENGVPFTVTECENANLEPDLEVLNNLALRPSQMECIESIIMNKGGLIRAATGFGKTFIIPILCKIFPRACVDIITRRQDVARTIVRECVQQHVFPALITGATRSRGTSRVNVCTIGSIHRLPRTADIVVLDECHELVTAKSLQQLFKYNKAIFYGLSATIGHRMDNADFRLEELCGKVIFSADYNRVLTSGNVVPIMIQWIPIPGSSSTGHTLYTMRKYQVWNNYDRNAVIAQVAREYYNNGLQVLVVVKTVEHGVNLKALLPEFELVSSSLTTKHLRRLAANGADIQRILDAVNRRHDMAKRFRDREVMGVIATEIWTTGVSFDDLEVLIRADADVSSIASIQTPGRVCRLPRHTDKQFGIIVDFVDVGNEKLVSRARKRFNTYKQMGWVQCLPDLTEVERFDSILRAPLWSASS